MQLIHKKNLKQNKNRTSFKKLWILNIQKNIILKLFFTLY